MRHRGASRRAPGSGRAGASFRPLCAVLVLALASCASARAPGSSGVAWRVIPFGDLAPEGHPQVFSWNALGIDPEDRVYVVFGDGGAGGSMPADCLLYRYDARSGVRSRLGSFRRASEEAGNAHEGEGMMKGHTALVYREGRMWMGSMPFHDAAEPANAGYRGSHLYAWDTVAGKLVDASAAEPGGFIQARSGIIALSPSPSGSGLIGLSIPRGDLLFFDPVRGKLEMTVPGPPAEAGKQLPRSLASAPDGRVFLAFGAEDSALYVHDPGSDGLRMTAAATTGGFWNGSAPARDGRSAYVSTVRGELYRLDFESESLTDLGHFLPADEQARGDRIAELFCLAISADGRKLYAIPTAITTRRQALYEYDIASGRVERLVDARSFGLFGKTFTGSDVCDSEGRIYFAVHDYGKRGYLLQLDPRGRLEPGLTVDLPAPRSGG